MARWIKVALLFIAFRATPILACPVCFQAKADTRIAFYVTTALLSFLPLIMIGGIVWWIVRQSRAAEKFSNGQSISVTGK